LAEEHVASTEPARYAGIVAANPAARMSQNGADQEACLQNDEGLQKSIAAILDGEDDPESETEQPYK
jgi:hypothetical protein